MSVNEPEIEDLLSMVPDMIKQQHEVAKEQLESYIEYKSKQGVSTCISHIQNKIITVEKNNPNNAVMTVLKSLCNELKMYL